MFNDNKSKHIPKVNSNQFALEDSYVRAGEQSIFLRARSLVEVFFYDVINGWTSVRTIDGSSGVTSVYLDLYPAVTHINFTSASSKKVVMYRLENGLSSDAISPVSGEEIAPTEKTALQDRVADIEGMRLVNRAQGFVPSQSPVDPSVFVDFGSDFSNLANKSLMLFVDGKAQHEDAYVIHEDDDGRIKFLNGIAPSDFGVNINIAVWE